MHSHTKFGIPTSNVKRYAPYIIILKIRSKVKFTVTQTWYATLRHHKIQTHTKFGIPISKNILRYAVDTIILKTRSEIKVKVTQKWYVTLHHPKIQDWNSYLNEYRRYAPDSMQCLETRSEVKFKVTVAH